MGTVIGAIASGSIPASATHASLGAWTSPTALLTGFLFVAACGYLAAVYLTGEAARDHSQRLQAYFTRRARVAAVGAGTLSLAALAALHGSNPALYARLTSRALPLVILAGVCGLAVLTLLALRWFTVVRVTAALGVAAVVWGWGVAQYPVLLPGTAVTLTSAGAPQATFDALIVLFAIAVLLIGPSLALLYNLRGRRLL
jgi:cytochrome d ubiquinol oxidase subunit II